MKKNVKVQIRITESEKSDLIRVGQRYPKGFSDFVRQAIKFAVGKPIVSGAESNTENDPMRKEGVGHRY